MKAVNGSFEIKNDVEYAKVVEAMEKLQELKRTVKNFRNQDKLDKLQEMVLWYLILKN